MLAGVLGLSFYELVNELMDGEPPKKPLCTKEDCRIAERILVREAALCGRSVIETNDEDKIGVLTDFDLAEFVLDSEDETDSENEADDSRD